MYVPGIKLFDENEIIEWEQAIDEDILDQYSRYKKRFIDPRSNKLKDYRHHRNTKYFHKNENKSIRIMTQRKFRRAMNKAFDREELYRPVPHDYKTYGWISW